MLDYSGFARGVEGLGPGKRVVLWVRGCGIGCPGCMTPELWATGQARSVDELARELAPALEHLDGLTISGGEPFDQPESLTKLIDLLRQKQDVELLVYSGYRLESLRSKGKGVWQFLKRIDLLIDGPFVQTALNTLQWRGSDNQRLHLLSSDAQKYADQPEAPMPEQRLLQLQMLGENRYRIIGIPRRGDLEAYRAAMAARGIIAKPEHE